MKKKIVLLTLLQLLTLSVCFSQKLPKNVSEEIKQTCVNLKTEIKLKLDSCRINQNVGDWESNLLSFKLLYGDGRLMFRDKEKEDSLYLLQLDWKMVYDEDMIKRIVQLLKNEYKKEELDALVNRQMEIGDKAGGWERVAMFAMKADQSPTFKHVKDSLNRYRDKNIHKDWYQDYEIFQYLKIDTTPRFHFVLDSIHKARKENTINEYLNKIHFDIKGLLSACYYVQDKRFIEPLINIVEHLDAFGLKYNEYSIDYASEVLVRMQVEPYCSNYLKKVSKSLEEVKKIDFVNVIDFLSGTLNNQDSFKELSKYLHSSAPTRAYYSEDEQDGGIKQAGCAYEDAFKEIQNNIENKDLQTIINAPDFDLERDRFKIYDWMQKNQGKYKIKRIW
jgi:hypothetical protein